MTHPALRIGRALRALTRPRCLGAWPRFEAKLEPRDAWVGVFWDRRWDGLHVYVCPVPFVVLHAFWAGPLQIEALEELFRRAAADARRADAEAFRKAERLVQSGWVLRAGPTGVHALNPDPSGASGSGESLAEALAKVRG